MHTYMNLGVFNNLIGHYEVTGQVSRLTGRGHNGGAEKFHGN